jgi:hypothetical protein
MYVCIFLALRGAYLCDGTGEEEEGERERERERTRVLSDGVREEKCKASARPGAP